MPSPQALLVELLGTFGMFMLVVTLWLSIVGVPVIFFLVVRFLWSRTVYVAPTPAMWAMMREWQRASLHAEHQATHEHQAELPTSDAPVRRVHLSAFGR
jgi:hypothetical protein